MSTLSQPDGFDIANQIVAITNFIDSLPVEQPDSGADVIQEEVKYWLDQYREQKLIALGESEVMVGFVEK